MQRSDYKLSFVSVSWSIFVLLCLLACSVKKNNSTTRLYHSVTTRYNVFYNGKQAFDEAYGQFYEGIKEGYTELIPFDPIAHHVGADMSERASLGLFDQALAKAEKAIKEHSLRAKPERKPGWQKKPKLLAEQNKTEYNGVLSQVWLLRGKAQLYNGSVQEALATFDYVSRLYKTEEDIRTQALLWQIRCLCLSQRPAEATELFAEIDSSKYRTNPLYMSARCAYYLALDDKQGAIHWLKLFVPYAQPRTQQARLRYLLGQLYLSQGQSGLAYKSFSKAMALSPPPALEFATRLKWTELTPGGSAKVQQLLSSMSRKAKYRPYLDQIYYAQGLNFLSNKDTINALKSFGLSVDSSLYKGTDYALSLVSQGDISLNQRKYMGATEKYQQALPALPKQHTRFPEIRQLLLGLEAMYPHAKDYYESDSLLTLARSPESYRLRIIDSTINALKVRELELERQRQRDSLAQVNREIASRLPGGMRGATNATVEQSNMLTQTHNNKFYYYNPELVRQGAKAFRQQWGSRPLEDLWRLSRKPNMSGGIQQTDSLSQGALRAQSDRQSVEDSTVEYDGTTTLDPYHRDYYLSKLPITPDAQREVERTLETAMFQQAQDLEYKVELLDHAQEMYQRLLERFPRTAHREESLFRLFSIASRLGLVDEANKYRAEYLRSYAQTSRGRELAEGDYIARQKSKTTELERIYQQAYSSYWQGEYIAIERAYNQIKAIAPNSLWAKQALFLRAMSRASSGHRSQFIQDLEEIVAYKANDSLETLCQDILQDALAGRPIYSGLPYPIHSMDVRESEARADSTQLLQHSGTSSRFAYILLAGSGVSDYELLYHLSNYHYTNHTQRTIPITPINLSESTQSFVLGDFFSITECDRYRQGLEQYLLSILKGRPIALIPIEQSNISQIQSTSALGNYIDQLDKLGLGTLAKSVNIQLVKEILAPKLGEVIVETASPTDPAQEGSSTDTSVIADLDLYGSVDSVDSVALVPTDQLLQESKMSYETAKQRQRAAEKERQKVLKQKEKEREEELKRKERERRAMQQEKLRIRREKERERERQRREQERLKASKERSRRNG